MTWSCLETPAPADVIWDPAWFSQDGIWHLRPGTHEYALLVDGCLVT